MTWNVVEMIKILGYKYIPPLTQGYDDDDLYLNMHS